MAVASRNDIMDDNASIPYGAEESAAGMMSWATGHGDKFQCRFAPGWRPSANSSKRMPMSRPINGLGNALLVRRNLKAALITPGPLQINRRLARAPRRAAMNDDKSQYYADVSRQQLHFGSRCIMKYLEIVNENGEVIDAYETKARRGS